MKRKIILTPECNKLWIINPSVFFNYDSVVLDDRDYQKLLNPKKDTVLTQTISKTVFQLKEFGLIEPIDYGKFFDAEVKKSIHNQSKRLVENFVSEIGNDFKSSKFYEYSIHTHVEFANYLEQFIMECSIDNQEEFNSYTNRYKRVIERMNLIKSGDLSDEVFEQLADALERITAKVLAGIFISQKAQVSTLYDTKEYTPFISSTLSDGIENLKFDFAQEDSFYNQVMNSLTKWETPTIKDKVHFFNVIEETYDFEKLKLALKQVEDFFKDINDTKPELVTQKLKLEFRMLEKIYQDEVNKAKGKFKEKATWHTIDMISGQFLGFLTPWINDAKEIRENKVKELVKGKILERSSLSSQLYYISELWNKVEPRSLGQKVNSLKVQTKKEEIWGENQNYLPWYEQK